MKTFHVILAAALCLLPISVCRADNGTKVRFDSKVWNFGRIEELGGEVEHGFVFTNISNRPIIIERVTTSCGCTAADYSKSPVRSGENGTVVVRFNPEGFTGRIEKAVSVAFVGEDDIVRLEIKGTVNPRPRTVADDYPFVLAGGVRAETANRAFGYLAQGKTMSMTIGIVNTSDRRVMLDTLWSTRSGFMQFDLPAWLEAGEKGLATLTYDLSKTRRYGMLSDQVRLTVDGVKAEIPFSASAVAVDDFEQDATLTPKAVFNPVFHNFGLVDNGEEASIEVEITNNGRAPLIIRSVECRTNTELELDEGDTIAPGATRKAKLTLRIGSEDFDSVFGGAVIITNDPSRPMRELRLTGRIEYK